MELHENHEQNGGQEFESSEEARAQMDEERVEEQTKDPSVLLTPTELKEGGVSGGDAGNTSGGDGGTGSGGGSLPGNSGDAAQPTTGNSGDASPS